jgi:hypothetical protein
MDKEDLCQKIKTIYPDIGRCGIDVDVDYDSSNDRWKVGLKRGNKFLETFLEKGDAELCMAGKQCVSLGLEIHQLADNASE